MTTPESAEIVRCRYRRRSGDMCTAEAAAPDMPTLLCTKHLARAIEYARDTYARFKKESRP